MPGRVVPWLVAALPCAGSAAAELGFVGALLCARSAAAELVDIRQPVDIRHIATLVDQSDKARFPVSHAVDPRYTYFT